MTTDWFTPSFTIGHITHWYFKFYILYNSLYNSEELIQRHIKVQIRCLLKVFDDLLSKISILSYLKKSKRSILMFILESICSHAPSYCQPRFTTALFDILLSDYLLWEKALNSIHSLYHSVLCPCHTIHITGMWNMFLATLTNNNSIPNS